MRLAIGWTLGLAAWLALAVVPARAGVDFDLQNANTFQRAWDGTAASDGLFACGSGDLNADGVDDLVLSSYVADTQGRTDNGAVYVVYGLHKSTGGFNSPITGAFNVRMDGASTNDNLAPCWVWDVNNDGLQDLVMRADGIGVLYVIYAPLPSGTGNIFDLSNPAKYNVKVVLPGNYGLPYPFMAEVSGDGIDDLLIEVPNADTNGTDAGSLYMIDGPLPAGTGNVRDMGLTSHFNLRVDGIAGTTLTGNWNSTPYWLYTGLPTSSIGDLNGDGAPDLAVGAPWDDSWARGDNGMVYIATGPFPSTTGNIWRVTDQNRWMARIGGAFGSGLLSRALIADLNGDGQGDLCMNHVPV